MNTETKLALININNFHHFYLKAALFHSTPVLDRRPCSHSSPVNARGGGGGGGGKLNAKHELRRNDSSYKEKPSRIWGLHNYDEHGPFLSHESSRSRYHGCGSERYDGWSRDHGCGSKRYDGRRARDHNQRFMFYEDDEEDEMSFRSSFGRNAGFNSRSFINDDESPRNSSGNRDSWNWKQRFEEEKQDDNESSYKLDIPETDLRNDRIALGLSGSGPLSLEHVKDAYRACALKWHPDRHSGASKAIAEEKFKVCSAAYESLCDKLALNK